MNKENMQKVLDYIVAHPEQFAMSSFGYTRHGCLTAACICGTANFLNSAYDLTNIITAAKFLGLSSKNACSLFFSQGIWEKYKKELNLVNPHIDYITHTQAVTMLTNLINGKWNFDDLET